MINNVILDVFIGLIFTYLLYSLFASVAMEIIASTLGLRAENLHYALKRMLMDEKNKEGVLLNYFNRTLNSITQIFGRSTNLENKALFNAFIEQPSIKYLGNGGSLITNRSPSYINSETFSSTLITALRKDFQIEELDVSSQISLGINHLKVNDTKLYLDSLFKDSDGDVQKFKLHLEKWFNDTMERAAGWYKKTSQLMIFIIGIILVLTFKVDTIAISQKLATDENVRKAVVKMAENTAVSRDSLNVSIDSLIQKTSALNYVLAAPTKDNYFNSLIGYTLTILAISLGAPFWFDLLNKFIRLRSGITTSSENKEVGILQSKTKINRVG